MNIHSAKVRGTELKPYIALIEDVVSGAITVDDFESLYLDMFKANEIMWAEPEYDILNGLFLDLDSYHADPAIRDPVLGLDAFQIMEQAKTALAQLKICQQELVALNEE